MYLVKIYSSGNVIAELSHKNYTGAIGMIKEWGGYNHTGLTYDIRKVKDVYGRNEKSV